MMFNCSKCNLKFKNQLLLTKHVKLIHESEKEFKCKDCGYQGNSETDLSQHVRSLNPKTNQNLLKDLKECKAKKKSLENEYSQCEQQLRVKTEEYEKLKIEVQDLRTIVDLRKQLDEKENDKLNRNKKNGQSMKNNINE